VTLEITRMSRIDATQTQIQLRDSIKWTSQEGFPKKSLENAMLAGNLDSTGIYYSLLRWYYGYISAPHYYATDRLCIVVSGIWWV